MNTYVTYIHTHTSCVEHTYIMCGAYHGAVGLGPHASDGGILESEERLGFGRWRRPRVQARVSIALIHASVQATIQSRPSPGGGAPVLSSMQVDIRANPMSSHLRIEVLDRPPERGLLITVQVRILGDRVGLMACSSQCVCVRVRHTSLDTDLFPRLAILLKPSQQLGEGQTQG